MGGATSIPDAIFRLENFSQKNSAHVQNSATANRDGHDKFQLWVIFGIHIIHIIMTKSKALASCLVLRQTCFRSSHLTLYDPCWKLIAFSQTDLAPCKTGSSGWKYHCRLLDYQSPVKVPFGSFVFIVFFH